jgi:hypothetical protein
VVLGEAVQEIQLMRERMGLEPALPAAVLAEPRELIDMGQASNLEELCALPEFIMLWNAALGKEPRACGSGEGRAEGPSAAELAAMPFADRLSLAKQGRISLEIWFDPRVCEGAVHKHPPFWQQSMLLPEQDIGEVLVQA